MTTIPPPNISRPSVVSLPPAAGGSTATDLLRAGCSARQGCAPSPPPPSPTLGFDDLAVDLAAFGFGGAADDTPAPDAPPSPLGALAYRPALYRRHAVSWCSVRAWRADAKYADLARLKLCKAYVDPGIIAAAAGEIAALLRLLFGPLPGWLVTAVACGHSRRHGCFGKRLGQAVAGELALEWVELFCDRFVAGVSHPKECKKLPPLQWRAKPDTPVLVIDDLASSGFHIEEALGLVRGLGLPAFGAVWISGNVK
jgi:hypothetical protein